MFKKFYTVNLFKNMNTNSLFSENTMPDHCSVVGCTQIRGREEGIRFFRFPIKNKEQRESWLRAVSRKSKGNKNWTPSKTAVVCSKHFVTGNPNPTRTHPDYTPSIFPTNHRNPSTTASLQRHSRVMKRTIVNEKFSNNNYTPLSVMSKDLAIQVNTSELEFPTDSSPISIFLIERDTDRSVGTLAQFPISASIKVGNDTDCLTSVKSVSSQTENQESFSIESLRNEEEWSSWTGISSGLFHVIHEFLSNKIGASRMISSKNKLLIFLVKLKTNLTFSAISSLFSINRNTASKIFKFVLDVAFDKFSKMLIWPSREIIQSRMPTSFKDDFPDCRVIIDASEIHCEKLSSVKNQILLYSNYKSTFTVKFLVGVAPSCEVTFLSKCYGGRTTDGQIVTESGFVKLLEPGDKVLADKGFPRIISSVENQGAFIVMPPFKRGQNQFSTDENVEGYKCARVRIHVERVIGRMKSFQILQFLPYYLLPQVDKILTVIAFLHNNMPEMIKE
jgi:hypothetical protein